GTVRRHWLVSILRRPSPRLATGSCRRTSALFLSADQQLVTSSVRDESCSTTTTRVFTASGFSPSVYAVKASDPPRIWRITSPGTPSEIGTETRPILPTASSFGPPESKSIRPSTPPGSAARSALSPASTRALVSSPAPSKRSCRLRPALLGPLASAGPKLFACQVVNHLALAGRVAGRAREVAPKASQRFRYQAWTSRARID